MSEEKEDQKTKKLGIWAVSNAVLSWVFLPIDPCVWVPVLAIAAVTSVLSRKSALGKVAIVLLILEIPAYLVVHTFSRHPL